MLLLENSRDGDRKSSCSACYFFWIEQIIEQIKYLVNLCIFNKKIIYKFTRLKLEIKKFEKNKQNSGGVSQRNGENKKAN